MNVEFKIERDFDGYFRNLTEKIMSEVENPLIKKVVINSGPYLPFEVDIEGIFPDGTIKFMWYSACRVMGRTSTDDEIIEYLNGMEIQEE